MESVAIMSWHSLFLRMFFATDEMDRVLNPILSDRVIALKPINMHGGGYSNFLKKIKTESQSICLAKFIIIDADRLA